jgi:hypothetical protein
MAKTFTRMAAQGDFIIRRIEEIPEAVEPIEPRDGVFVVAESETHHHHVMEAEHVTAYKPAGVKEVDLYQMFLKVDAPSEINHLRSYDTHETLIVPPGKYEIRRQREYVAEGFRRAAD